ncbi:pyruvate, phosphate dikinase [Rhodobacteraceae bacterium 2CG4]|uniref:Pyruvate, phosphate dikinase n=1 Tax=Halovulum marinum TaxID=2662447 RepID=A0A6L5Z201_9RHOB|nr:pyruvate, phosphate dikinase [Halovulum marinum]MSU90100.1 pyruvate, phosphate dikinase [Halovulum marinum]
MTEPPVTGIAPLRDAAGAAEQFGARAERLARMAALGLPVPGATVLDFDTVRAIAEGARVPAPDPSLGPVLALRGSAGDRRWGGPQAILNVGLCDAVLPALVERIGRRGALAAYARAIRAYAVRVSGLDPEDFDNIHYDRMKLCDTLSEADLLAIVEESKRFYADEVEMPFPQTLEQQLDGAVRAMVDEWHGLTARILRESSGAPADAGLGLILQRMVFGLGQGRSGAGFFQAVDSTTGRAAATGRFLPDAQGNDAARGARTPHMITEAERAAAGQTLPSLQALDPDAFAALARHAAALTSSLGDVFELPFTVEAGTLHILDATPVRRSPSAAVQIAVDLVGQGAITREIALLRVEPRNLIETLHPRIDPNARRDIFGTGLPASPGAATGKICFSPEAAMALHAQGEDAILVRVETSPEDIRGMHAAVGVLTVRGGMTSHAAVIARGLGLPCVVGAGELHLDLRRGRLTAPDGRAFGAGDSITIDGTAGEALAGAPAMLPAVPSAAFDTLMGWADEVRALGVRANADTPADAALARRFKVDGIGLCRTEHMFFEGDRIDVMREMILASNGAERQVALDRLLPMQRGDFEALFGIMEGLPVTIRLLDPPLHEFLPHGQEELAALARAMNLPVEDVIARAEDLREFNPMLGKRGVRLGITMPEIYDMQARAIFEAAHNAGEAAGVPVIPEIMIPLVSANRELELVKARVDSIAAAVAAERGRRLDYRIGVMVETPRGALRAADLARSSAFLSFGTNDLTQMTYGLSRDDAGRFMRDYVAKGVFPEDPFHSLDVEGVGELLLLATNRGRSVRSDLTLGLCGEHGGDPESIRFCKIAGFDYVSCSPFRVPIARLAAAQVTILTEGGGHGAEPVNHGDDSETS